MKNVEDIYELSPLQEGILFHSLLTPGVYFQQLCLVLEGDLEATSFRQAWEMVTRQHPVLRTSFHWEGLDQPVQVVHRSVALPWQEIDWSGLVQARQPRRLREFLEADLARDFQLTAPPLMRLRLIRSDDRLSYFAWTCHHLLLDGLSLSRVLRQAFSCYRSLCQGLPVDMPRIRPFRDYIVWLQQQDLGEAKDFWQTVLKGFTEPTVLRIGREVGQVARSSKVGHCKMRLPRNQVEQLQSLAQRCQVTLNTVVLGAWAMLFSRCSARSDVVFGVTVFGRPPQLPHSEEMVGLFVNTLPARVVTPPRSSLKDWLKQVHDQQVEARRFESTPLTRIQHWSEVPPGLPLFEALFVFENYRTALSRPSRKGSAGAKGKLKIRQFSAVESSNYPLNVIVDVGAEMGVQITYDLGRFGVAAVSRLLRHLKALLQEMTSGAGLCLGQLSFLTAAERHQLALEFNDSQEPLPETCLHQLYEAQQALTPQSVAVVNGQEHLSYGCLNRRANQTANLIRSLGAGPESLLGLCLERSLEMMEGLLGILKAGSAYVPLDPTCPARRLEYLVADSAPAAVLTQMHLLPCLPQDACPLICLDSSRPAIGRRSDSNLGIPAHPSNLAYVMYTSGSTGNPKGVAVPHRGVCNRLLWGQRAYRLSRRDRVLQKTPFTFDVSVWEFFWPLLNGACLILARPEGHKDPAYLNRLLREQRVTRLHFVPSMLQAYLDSSNGQPSRCVQQVFCSGEALSLELQRRFFDRFEASLHNLYGPTEGSIEVSRWACRREEEWSCLPIGRPIGNLQLYVLDSELNPVPIGVAGQLCIGGAGPVRGYWGRAGLTAVHFVPDPIGPRPGARLYKTGDRACLLPDGNIEYLGRLDHQVKVRGFRIELGEIESHLDQHPAVKEAAAMVRQGSPNDQRLVAYVVVEPSADDKEENWNARLRKHLAGRLPNYMVPSAVAVLESLPLTPSGKVDRNSLPDPSAAVQAATEFIQPRSQAEQAIAAIWRDLLQVERVGLEDNFFDLGGHSLLMIRLLARLQKEFDARLQLVELFEHPTVGSQAQRLAPLKASPTVEPQPQAASPRQAEPARAEDPLPGAPSRKQVAVIGMAGRFPGAGNLEEFWRNLRDGVESITFFSDDDLKSAGLRPAALQNPDRVKAMGMLEGADLFDASFFGMNPREAEITDPQQRLFLETAWTALEDAGYDPHAYGGRIGLYAGVSYNTYWVRQLNSRPDLYRTVGGFQIELSNDKDYLPTRASYKLNLRGPSVTVQTACSTSLVAIHQACQSLLNGECSMALAGGSSVSAYRKQGYLAPEGGILSPDGHCRAFDAKAAGLVPGSGVGVVALKLLDDALADGDHVYAVIRGSAINNDGSLKAGYTAPSVQGQVEVIRQALAVSGVPAESVSLIEAHGSGTRLGDTIEMRALQEAFGEVKGKALCAVGSVKTNIGHADAAAGVAGFIKAVLAIQHEQLPPSLNFEEPDSEVDSTDSPFFVNTALQDWNNGAGPRRAGVSSFGMGGTNAHLILEEAPAQPPTTPSRPSHVLTLSARSETALQAAALNLGRYLQDHPQADLADVAYTLQLGRRTFNHRRIVVCKDREEAQAALKSAKPNRAHQALEESKERPVAFLFPGQGAQYAGMGRELYQNEPSFGRHLDRCADLLKSHLEADLREVLFAKNGSREPGRKARGNSSAGHPLFQSGLAQPALFAVEYALARMWMDWGVRPHAMIGHSIGEYAAACLSGVFGLEDALWLIVQRGRLVQSLPEGAMLAVPLPERQVRPLLSESLSLASINGPSLCVVAGLEEAVLGLEKHLLDEDVECYRLPLPLAGHSRLMEPILEAFAQRVRRVSLQRPQIPFLSGVTGDWIDESEAIDPLYWTRHLRQTALFAPGLEKLLQQPQQILLEVGPGQSLSAAALQHPDRQGRQAVLSTLYYPQALGPLRRPANGGSESAFLMTAVGKLWLAGAFVDWPELYSGQRRRRLSLPTYPFERKRFWVEPAKPSIPEPPAGPPEKRESANSAPAAQPSMPAEMIRSPAPAPSDRPGAPPARNPTAGASTAHSPALVKRVLQQQLKIMSRQLEMTSKQIGLLRRSQRGRASSKPGAFGQSGQPQSAAAAASDPAIRAEARDQPAPLTPAQQWFMQRGLAHPSHFNMARMLLTPPGARPTGLLKALQCVFDHHEAWRHLIDRQGTEWRQSSLPRGTPLPWCMIDLSRLRDSVRTAALKSAAASLQPSLDLLRGPLVRAACFQLGAGEPGRLLVVAHHAAMDIVSWQIVTEDLARAWSQIQGQREVRLPASTPFSAWAGCLQSYARRGGFAEEAAYWLAEERHRATPLPVDHPQAANTAESERTRKISLDPLESRLVCRGLSKAHGLLVSEILLAVLAQTFVEWSGAPSLLIDLEGHGREDLFDDVDLSRTVGWFTCFYPLLLETGSQRDVGSLLEAVKESFRAVPRGGIGYGALRYLSGEKEVARKLEALPQAQIVFNYLGGRLARGDSPALAETEAASNPALCFRQTAPESCGPNQNPGDSRSHWFEIDGVIAGGQLQLIFRYSRNICSPSTIEALAQGAANSFARLMDYCRSLKSDDRGGNPHA